MLNQQIDKQKELFVKTFEEFKKQNELFFSMIQTSIIDKIENEKDKKDIAKIFNDIRQGKLNQEEAEKRINAIINGKRNAN